MMAFKYGSTGLKPIIEALHPKKKISGGCNVTRWGCCLDGITPKLDSLGTNCVLGS